MFSTKKEIKNFYVFEFTEKKGNSSVSSVVELNLNREIYDADFTS